MNTIHHSLPHCFFLLKLQLALKMLFYESMIPLPDIRQLRIFLALEENRSFTAAANQLQLTQSAVSHSIKSLESLLNCILIERVGKKCVLSPHGEVFLHHAKQAVQQLESATKKIQTLNKWGYSSIKIGASHALCQYVFPKALSNFYKIQQRAEVFITPGSTIHQIKKLKNGELDLAFGIAKSSFENDFNFTPIIHDEMCFVTGPTHPWVNTPPTSEDDYDKQRYLSFGKDTVTQQILNSHLSGLGIETKATLTMTNVESIKEMTLLDLGVGILSDWTIKKELRDGTLCKHNISPPPQRQWGVYTHKSKSLSLPEEEFISTFSKELINIIGS